MRIAFLSSMYGAVWGGSEELWGRTALHLRQQGHEVFIGMIDWPEPSLKRDELRAAGCRVSIRVDHPGFRDRILNRVRPDSRRVLRQDPVPSELLEFRPDLVVISQMFTDDGLDWMEFCRKQRLKYATVVQAATECRWPDDSLVSRLRVSYLAAERTFFVSRHNLELCQKQIAADLPNASLVWNPFESGVDDVLPWPEPSDGMYRAACVGRIQPDAKGQDILIDVLAQAKWKQRPLLITFFGKGCNSRWAEEYCQWRGVNADFGGFVTLADIWGSNQLLVHPSRKEGLPIVVVEAALCGRGVVATATAGIPELVEEGVNGFLAPYAEANLFDRALERAWECRHQWRDLGFRAREVALSKIGREPVTAFASLLSEMAR